MSLAFAFFLGVKLEHVIGVAPSESKHFTLWQLLFYSSFMRSMQHIKFLSSTHLQFPVTCWGFCRRAVDGKEAKQKSWKTNPDIEIAAGEQDNHKVVIYSEPLI